jgi:hypothetical protein
VDLSTALARWFFPSGCALLLSPWLGLASTALVPLGDPAARIAWRSLDFERFLLTGSLLRNARAGMPRWNPMIAVAAHLISVFAALMGQMAPLIRCLVTACWRLLELRNDHRAGVLPAWLTIKPELRCSSGVSVISILRSTGSARPTSQFRWCRPRRFAVNDQWRLGPQLQPSVN